MTPLLPSNTLLQRPLFRRPLTIILPALHQRSRQREQVDGHAGRAPRDDDLGVDLGIQVRFDAFPDRVVGEEGRGERDEGAGGWG